MTRIVLDPVGMRALVGRFDGTAGGLVEAGVRVANAPVPELPRQVADVPLALTRLGAQLAQRAEDLAEEARTLRVRAALAELGVIYASVLRDARLHGLGGRALLDRLEEDPRLLAARGAVAAASAPDELLRAAGRWKLELQFRWARTTYHELGGPARAIAKWGRDDPRTLQRLTDWRTFMENVGVKRGLAEQALSVEQGSRAELRLTEELTHAGGAIRGIRLAGQAAAPLDVVLGLYTVVAGSTYSGSRGEIDRGVAGASVAGGLLLIAASVGWVPVGGQVVGTVLVVSAGLWVLGNVIADEYPAIARLTVAGGHWVGRHEGDVAAWAAGPLTGVAWEYRQPIEHGLAAAGSATEHAGGWAVHHAGGVKKAFEPWTW